MGSKAKQAAGVVAAPVTGGLSLAYTANEMKKEKEKEERKRRALKEERERSAELETENKRLAKEYDIATRGTQKRSGISSLIGSGTDSLG